MTHEYAPAALPELQEATVHRRTVEIDVDNPYISPAERKALDLLRGLPERLEARRIASHEQQLRFATIVGAEAVNAVVVAPSVEKQEIVARNLVLNLIEQNVDTALAHEQSPADREAIIMAVLQRLQEVGHERIDPAAHHAIAVRDAMISERDEQIQVFRAFHGTTEQVVESLKESTLGDPDAMEMIEEAIRPLEEFSIEELPELPDVKRISTAELSLLVNGDEEEKLEEIVMHQVSERPLFAKRIRTLAKGTLLSVMAFASKQPAASSASHPESVNA